MQINWRYQLFSLRENVTGRWSNGRALISVPESADSTPASVMDVYSLWKLALEYVQTQPNQPNTNWKKSHYNYEKKSDLYVQEKLGDLQISTWDFILV